MPAPRPRRPAQLALMTLTDHAKLREDLDTAASSIRFLQRELDAAQAQLATLTTEHQAMQRALDHERRARELLTIQRDSLQQTVTLLQMTVDLQKRGLGQAGQGTPPWLDHAVRGLIAVAHPDRWSAGQAATALAHEVTSQLNALRVKLRAQ